MGVKLFRVWQWMLRRGIAAALAPALLLGISALLFSGITYHRWDNAESLTATVIAAHRQWLDG